MTLTALLFWSIWLINDGYLYSLLLYALNYAPVLLFSLVISWYNVFNERRLFLWNLIDDLNNAELREANQKLWKQSHTDELTGLPNRSLLQDRIVQAMLGAERKGTRAALMYVDLDEFKPVNDTHGHAVGDLLLQEAARRMSEVIRATDTIARFGGDEFVVVSPELEGDQQALLVANKLIAAFRQPFHVKDLEIAIGCSIGIALFPDHGASADDLHRQADRALYKAKTGGRNQAVVAGSPSDDQTRGQG